MGKGVYGESFLKQPENFQRLVGLVNSGLYQNFPPKKKDKEDIKCFKCGKKGHIAPNSKVKEIIANLDITKHLKKQMINLIKTES